MDLITTQTSFWEYDRYLSAIDVVVMGSGIVGLTAALVLKEKQPRLRVVVVERGALPSGASTKNAGFACFGSVSELIDDLQHSSSDEVWALVEKRYHGLLRLRERLGDATIRYEALGGYEVFDDETIFGKCAEQISHFNHMAGKITGLAQTYQLADESIASFGFRQVRHLIHNTGEGQIDTGRAVEALLEKARAAGVVILNGLGVTALENESQGVALITNQGHVIRTKQVLICTNGFAQQFLPDEDVVPARAQVLITEPIADLRVQGAFHYDRGYYYFRNVGNRLLFGGGRNLDFRGEQTTEHATTALIQDKLDELLRTVILPDTPYRVAMRWSGTMGVGGKKYPVVKQVRAGVFAAVRMGGMGVALGSLTGEEAADLVLQQM